MLTNKSLKSKNHAVYSFVGKKKKKAHALWSKVEKKAVFKHLGMFLSRQYLPGKNACMRCIKKSAPVLDNRHWSAVKYCVMNAKKRAARNLSDK